MKKKKPSLGRNYLAIHAQFKTSSGAMKDLKKEANKNHCRQNDLDSEEDFLYDDPKDNFGDE